MKIFSYILVKSIRIYQLTLSLVIGQRCRFYPSCSSYAIEAIEIHGPGKGSLMALRRISKCHPFHPGGVDPVPSNDKNMARQ